MQKLPETGRARESPSLELSRNCDPTNTLISDYWPPEL